MQEEAGQAENEAVRAPKKAIVLTAIAFCTLLAGAAQSAQGPTQATKTHAAPPPEVRIDINRASADELMKIPGMTPTWAARIVRFRPYRTKQDLVDQGVVTTQVYDRIKDYVIAHREK